MSIDVKAKSVTDEVSSWGEFFGEKKATVREVLDDFAARISEINEQKGKPGQKIEGLTQVAQECLKLSDQLQTKMIDKDVFLLELKKRCDTANAGHARVHSVTSKILLSVAPFLESIKIPEAKDGEAAESKVISINQNELSHAIESLDALKRYLDENPIGTATVEKVAKEKKVITPHILLDTAALAGKLGSLQEELNKLMKGVNSKTDIEVLKVQYAAKMQEFDELIISYNALIRPVNRNLHQTEEQVKTYQEQQIPPEAIKFCAIAQRSTEKEVLDELEGRRKINADRIERHDALAKAWANVLIGKEAIEWELKRIEIYANVFTEVCRLNDKLSGLEGNIDSCKDILRAQVPTLKYKPSELTKLVENIQKTLTGLYDVYGECASLGTKQRPTAEANLKALTELKEKGGKDLNDALEKVHLFDAETKKTILANAAKSVGVLQDERQELFVKLQSRWHTVFERLDLSDTVKSLTYELVRMCYTCEKNNGIIPADSFYKSRLFGWTPAKEPVKSPWTPTEEKPKVEDKKVEDKPNLDKKDAGEEK